MSSNFPACCQLLSGSIPTVLLHKPLAALGQVVHRDVVILAHKLRLPDAGKWKHPSPEDIVNDVQKAVSKDFHDSFTTILLVTEIKQMICAQRGPVIVASAGAVGQCARVRGQWTSWPQTCARAWW